jgi:GTP-binding protein YchF
MKVGIIGLPQTGKKTLFQVLTGSTVHDSGGPAKPIPGIADIADKRFDRLVALYQPKKEARARIDLVLLPKMEQETIAKGDIFRDISDVDAICHLVRAFEDDSIYHAAGSVDPLRDVEAVNSELLLHDQIFLEKRIERLELALKKMKDERQGKELALLKRMQTHLEAERPLRMMPALSEEEELLIRSYPLITRKEMILVFNVGEEQLGDHVLLERVGEMLSTNKMEAMLVSAKVESEIALLESEEERRDFLRDIGIEEPSLEVLASLCLKALGQISFFTVGKDEVRQWLVRMNAPAPVAAGVIHSDLQKGFIRAEVMKYEELIALGSEAELKKAGKLAVQGKEYIVADGDILNIRFNI